MGRVRLIFSIAPPKCQSTIERIGPPVFLAYMKRMDIIPQAESLESSRRRAVPDLVTNILVLEYAASPMAHIWEILFHSVNQVGLYS